MKRVELTWLVVLVTVPAVYFGLSASPSPTPLPSFTPSARIGGLDAGAPARNQDVLDKWIRGVVFGPVSLSVGVVSENGESYLFGTALHKDERLFLVLKSAPGADLGIVEANYLSKTQLKRVFAEMGRITPPRPGHTVCPSGSTIYSLRWPSEDEFIFDAKARGYARAFPATFVGRLFRKHGWTGR